MKAARQEFCLGSIVETALITHFWKELESKTIILLGQALYEMKQYYKNKGFHKYKTEAKG